MTSNHVSSAIVPEIRTLSEIYPSSFTYVRFWTKIEFLNIVKRSRRYRGATSSATGSWQSRGEGSGGKVPEKLLSFLHLEDK